MTIAYKPRGTCSKRMNVKVEDGVIQSVHIEGGCGGNTQAVSRLVEGMTAQEAIARMEGIQCGSKGTSCPDQLAKALKIALTEEEKKNVREE